MAYEVAAGFDNEIDLERLDPQPRTLPGIQVARRIYVPGNAYPDGEKYVNLTYNVLTEAEKNALDAAFGVSEDTLMAEVTIRLLNNDDTFSNYNARVEWPEVGSSAKRTQFGWGDVTYAVHIVEAL